MYVFSKNLIFDASIPSQNINTTSHSLLYLNPFLELKFSVTDMLSPNEKNHPI